MNYLNARAIAPQEGYVPILRKVLCIVFLIVFLAAALLWIGRQPILEHGVQQQKQWCAKTALLFGADPDKLFPLDERSSRYTSPLLQAINVVDKPLVTLLLRYDANPDASKPSYPLFAALQQDLQGKESGFTAVLLEYGAKPDIRSPGSGDSPLHRAVHSGDTDLVQLLLQHKSDANVRNNKGIMPLLHARSQAMIDMLLSETDVMATDHFGNNVLLQAIAENADTALIKAVHIANPSLVAQHNTQGQTALHHAARQNNAAIVDWAIGLDSIDVNARDKHGKPALLYASDSTTAYTLAAHTDFSYRDTEGNSFLMAAIGEGAGWAAVGACLYFGGNMITSPNKAGFTPLMKAIGKGNERAVVKLIGKGASVTRTSRAGASVYALAQSSKNPVILQAVETRLMQVEPSMRWVIGQNQVARAKSLKRGGKWAKRAGKKGLRRAGRIAAKGLLRFIPFVGIGLLVYDIYDVAKN